MGLMLCTLLVEITSIEVAFPNAAYVVYRPFYECFQDNEQMELVVVLTAIFSLIRCLL